MNYSREKLARNLKYLKLKEFDTYKQFDKMKDLRDKERETLMDRVWLTYNDKNAKKKMKDYWIAYDKRTVNTFTAWETNKEQDVLMKFFRVLLTPIGG